MIPNFFTLGTADQPQQDSDVDTLVSEKRMHKTVLFNDESHTYDYVVEMLTKSCELAAEAAFRCAVEVDLTGKTIVFQGTHTDCLLASEKIKSYGPDHRLPHSNASMESEVQG